ncbi:unnamed protein product, partial [Oppiella nova]
MLEKEGANKLFDPRKYVYLMCLNMLAGNAFGTSYDVDDEEFKFIKYVINDFNVETRGRVMLWQFSALFRLLDRRLVAKQRQNYVDLIALIADKFSAHYADYTEGAERDMCDALITARKEALREGRDGPHLTDDMLAI